MFHRHFSRTSDWFHKLQYGRLHIGDDTACLLKDVCIQYRNVFGCLAMFPPFLVREFPYTLWAQLLLHLNGMTITEACISTKQVIMKPQLQREYPIPTGSIQKRPWLRYGQTVFFRKYFGYREEWRQLPLSGSSRVVKNHFSKAVQCYLCCHLERASLNTRVQII